MAQVFQESIQLQATDSDCALKPVSSGVVIFVKAAWMESRMLWCAVISHERNVASNARQANTCIRIWPELEAGSPGEPANLTLNPSPLSNKPRKLGLMLPSLGSTGWVEISGGRRPTSQSSGRSGWKSGKPRLCPSFGFRELYSEVLRPIDHHCAEQKSRFMNTSLSHLEL